MDLRTYCHDGKVSRFIQDFSNRGELLSGKNKIMIQIMIKLLFTYICTCNARGVLNCFYKTTLGLRTLEIFVPIYSDECDDLDRVENGRAQMKQWLLEMKGLNDVHISGIKVSLAERFFSII